MLDVHSSNLDREHGRTYELATVTVVGTSWKYEEQSEFIVTESGALPPMMSIKQVSGRHTASEAIIEALAN
jgi:hypothetical protein